MKLRTKLTLLMPMFLVVTLPLWGMGPAVFLDSKRTLISQTPSPDGKRVAQVERILVGGVPSIVVMVRPEWMPNWYLTGCAAASHYREADARVHWATNDAIVVTHSGDQRFWDIGSAPFHSAPCDGLTVTFDARAS
jgi:hypothetical protein